MSAGIPPRMCPLLTMATIKVPEKPKVLTLGGAPVQEDEGFTAVPCSGPQCMLFHPVFDAATKRVVDGSCALALIPLTLSHVNHSIRQAAALDGATAAPEQKA